MSMRSPDDRLFIDIRTAYHQARADKDNAAVGRITRQNFNWLMDYMETKLSMNLSRKFRTVKKWKTLCGFLEDCEDNAKSRRAQKMDIANYRTAQRLVKEIIYIHDPKPTKERL